MPAYPVSMAELNSNNLQKFKVATINSLCAKRNIKHTSSNHRHRPSLQPVYAIHATLHFESPAQVVGATDEEIGGVSADVVDVSVVTVVSVVTLQTSELDLEIQAYQGLDDLAYLDEIDLVSQLVFVHLGLDVAVYSLEIDLSIGFDLDSGRSGFFYQCSHNYGKDSQSLVIPVLSADVQWLLAAS